MSERTISRAANPLLSRFISDWTDGMYRTIDFGCGVGTYADSVRSARYTGIDSFQPYIDEIRKEGHEAICGDMRSYRALIEEPYSVAMFIDTIEHLEKVPALSLLLDCQQHFTRILVFTPVGEYPQEPCDGNEAQRHLSTWWPKDLDDLGFSVKELPDFHNENEPGRRAAMFGLWVRP